MIWRLSLLFVTTALFAAEPIRPYFGARPGAEGAHDPSLFP
jgi:hypothetical protein